MSKLVRTNAQRGFSIIEILIVMAIVAGIVGAIIVMVQSGAADTKLSTAKAQIGQVEAKLEAWSYRNGGGFPASSQGLEALIPSGGLSNKEKNMYNDPWGQPLNYVYPGVKNPRKFDLFSSGPDLTPNTPDDIGNW